MAEEDSSQEKTEEPTSRKIEKAREEGQIPRSKELNTSAVLLFGSIGLLVLGPAGAEHIAAMARYNFTLDRMAVFDTAEIFRHIGASLWSATLALTPWLMVVLFAAIFGPIGLRSEERRVGKECRFGWWPDR